MAGERVLGRVVGEEQDAERRQHEDRGISGDRGESQHRPEDAHQELQLLRLEQQVCEPPRMGPCVGHDLLRRGAELRIAVVQAAGEVFVGAAAERRNDDANDGQEGREAAGEDAQAQLPVAFGEQDVDAEPDADERQLLLDEKGRRQAEEKPSCPAFLQEVDREAERQDRERELMEIEQVDEGDGQEQEVHQNPGKPLKAGLELEPRQQVERPDAEREEERLDDQQRFRTWDEQVGRHQQQVDRRKVIRQVGVRLRLHQAHRRLQEPALRRIPEDLVEDSQVRSKGVVGHVAQDRQDAVEHEVSRRQDRHDVGLGADQAALNFSHERDL